MAKKIKPVRFAPEASHLPAWDADHPLAKEHGWGTYCVETEFGSTNVDVPALPDDDLANVIARAKVYFQAQFAKAHRDVPYLLLEAVAFLYYRQGGTRAAWCEYLQRIGLEVAPQSTNLFIALLKVICGDLDDQSRRLGKMAQCLDRWVTIYKPGPAALGDNESDDYGWPDPQPINDVPGSSDFVAWTKHMHGYGEIAKKHAKWLRERDCLHCGTHYTVEGKNCPECNRPIHDQDPHFGDIRVVGLRQTDDDGTEIVHAEHPDAQEWRIQHYEPGEQPWLQIGDAWTCHQEAETEAVRLRREKATTGFIRYSTNPSGKYVTS